MAESCAHLLFKNGLVRPHMFTLTLFGFAGLCPHPGALGAPAPDPDLQVVSTIVPLAVTSAHRYIRPRVASAAYLSMAH